MSTVNEKMTAIADAIRANARIHAPLSLDAMVNGITEVYVTGCYDTERAISQSLDDTVSNINGYLTNPEETEDDALSKIIYINGNISKVHEAGIVAGAAAKQEEWNESDAEIEEMLDAIIAIQGKLIYGL